MKMGEICVGASGQFEMMTPSGLRPVTLRCRLDGVVMVDEVADEPGILKPLQIGVISSTQGVANRIYEHARRYVEQDRRTDT